MVLLGSVGCVMKYFGHKLVVPVLMHTNTANTTYTLTEQSTASHGQSKYLSLKYLSPAANSLHIRIADGQPLCTCRHLARAFFHQLHQLI